jgi:NADH-quinone oxidoreductase subunit E
MPLLREVQTALHYVPAEQIEEIAEIVGVTATEVRAVMSFYSTYSTVPQGKYHLQVCATLSCALAGSDELWDDLCETLGISPGEVTPDGLFSVQKVECLGSCGTAPLVQVGELGYHERLSRQDLHALLDALRRGEYPGPHSPLPVFVHSGQQEDAAGARHGAELKPLGENL